MIGRRIAGLNGSAMVMRALRALCTRLLVELAGCVLWMRIIDGIDGIRGTVGIADSLPRRVVRRGD
jgi:hypothetical protein